MSEEDKYEVLEKIGQGSFGVIRKVRRSRDGYVCCRKEISYTRMSQKEKEQLQAELSILKELRHPNIVAYIDRIHLKASHDLHVYMEYCGNGDLGQVIKKLKSKGQYADEAFVWSIFAQIVSALYRCHYGQDPPEAGPNVMGLGNDAKPLKATQKQPMILHRDLKPENIFLGADNSVKLGDFGLSKILQSHDFASTYVGTPYYMSPEICMSEKYTLQSDIWALGCIIYELCTWRPPFDAKTHFDLIGKIRGGRFEALPKVYSPELTKIVNSCLQVRWDLRPDTATLLNLPAVKLMRKEQEVVQLGQALRKEREMVKQTLKEAGDKMAAAESDREVMRVSIDDKLRREWEVRARLEIDKQVQHELENLRVSFETEVARRVDEQVEQRLHAMRSSNSAEPVRSSTPEFEVHESYASTASTLNEPSEFPSTTDLSSLSLESPGATKPKASTPAKRPARQPLARAYTTAGNDFGAPSPMDIHMADPSPMPSLAGLSLSPRRGEATAAPKERRNIFAAAAERWEPINIASSQPGSPSSPSTAAFADVDSDADEDDDLPALPSPTRARSSNGSRGKEHDNDPFKVLNSNNVPNLKPTTARRTQLKPLSQRLTSAPNLARQAATNNGTTRARPSATVPGIGTSPSRRTAKAPGSGAAASDNTSRSASDAGSPVRRAAAAMANANAGADEASGLRSKKGNGALLRAAAARNNHLQGRTLVELAQARTGVPGAVSEGEESGLKKKSGKEIGFAAGVAQWDPENPDCPSPFLKKRSAGAADRFR